MSQYNEHSPANASNIADAYAKEQAGARDLERKELAGLGAEFEAVQAQGVSTWWQFTKNVLVKSAIGIGVGVVVGGLVGWLVSPTKGGSNVRRIHGRRRR
jgi:hypothetical protein